MCCMWLKCWEFKFHFVIKNLTHRHVLSIKAPYVSENPISRSHIRAVQVYRFGLGYITMFCKNSEKNGTCICIVFWMHEQFIHCIDTKKKLNKEYIFASAPTNEQVFGENRRCAN